MVDFPSPPDDRQSGGDSSTDVDADLATLLEGVEDTLRRAVHSGRTRAERHGTRYVELWDQIGSAVRGGKRRRPWLVLACFRELGGRDYRAAIQFAAAVELLHTMFLLHDDVIDGDDHRRGAPNLIGAFSSSAREEGASAPVASHWGRSAAILAGDLVLSAALRLVATLPLESSRRDALLNLVDESVFRTAAGELADVAFAAGFTDPAPADIRQMMADKTAHYSLELPLRGGAILAGADPDLESTLTGIGHSLGLIFQMRDDVLGVFGDADLTGKSTSSDLREGKQTLLVAFARDSPAWREAASGFGRQDAVPAAIDALRAALDVSGARRRTEEEIDRERAHAYASIASSALPEGLRTLLSAEVGFAAERHS